MPEFAGLYVHMPFCVHKCHYCDFYSLVEHPDRLDARQSAFTERLIAELSISADYARLNTDTIFIGGGTPTLLPPRLWERVLKTMRGIGLIDRVREFTVEANPETVDGRLCEVLAAGGVNRMSIGAQSFDPALLKTLERWHDPASVPRAMTHARSAGIDNLNLDLIFATPGQTLETLTHDLETALAFQPRHLSCYNLTYEANTAMTQRLKMGEFERLDESLEREMYALVMETLACAGYEQYEISNWAKLDEGKQQVTLGGRDARPIGSPDLTGVTFGGWDVGVVSPWRCAHNLLYWRNGDWLGVGPAAASHLCGRRWKNQPNLSRYIDSSPWAPITDQEHLEPARQVGEALMMGLRLSDGVSRHWLSDHLDTDDPRHHHLADFQQWGLMEQRGDYLRLTREGLFVADTMLAKLL